MALPLEESTRSVRCFCFLTPCVQHAYIASPPKKNATFEPLRSGDDNVEDDDDDQSLRQPLPLGGSSRERWRWIYPLTKKKKREEYLLALNFGANQPKKKRCWSIILLCTLENWSQLCTESAPNSTPSPTATDRQERPSRSRAPFYPFNQISPSNIRPAHCHH